MVLQDHWMFSLQRVFYPMLAAVGIPSNVITIVIFWRRNCMLSKSSTYYLMAMSAADTGVVVLIVVLELTLKYHVEEPFWSREPWCSLRDVFNYGIYNTSTWLVVTFTAERFVAVGGGSLKGRRCAPYCALCTIGGVVLLGHLCAVPYYWSNISVFNEKHNRWVCIYRHEASAVFVRSLVWFQTVLVYVLPYLIIFSLNGLILRLIAHSNRVNAANPGRAAPLRARKRKSVVLLVTVSMSFALLSITRFVTQIMLRTGHYKLDRNDYSYGLNVAADVGTMLSLSNAAVNMYLYTCTQPRFRREVAACMKALLSCCKREPGTSSC